MTEYLRSHIDLPVESSNGAVEVRLRSKEDALRVLQVVQSSGIAWQSFSTVQDTLEDVFIRLVGRLDEGAESDAAPRERK
jgi:hypothetical protein